MKLLAFTLHPTTSLSHYGEKNKTVNRLIVLRVWGLCPWRNKRPFSGMRQLQCSATIQWSCRRSGCPHTAAPPTLLLWQITEGRWALPEDPAGPQRGAGWWVGGFVEMTTETGLHLCFLIFFVQGSGSHLRLKEHMCVCVFARTGKHSQCFVCGPNWWSVAILIVSVILVFSLFPPRSCWISFCKGTTTERLATDEDDDMTKAVQERWTLPLGCAAYEFKYQYGSCYNSNLTSTSASVCFRHDPLHSCYRAQHLVFWNIRTCQSFKKLEGHLTSLSDVLKGFYNP